MNTLPTQRASQIRAEDSQLSRWLVEELWSDQAVGILGGQPKCCKSFLALDMAVSVASGAPCLRRFAVHRPGPVLIFPAEDSLRDVRQRLEGICAAAGVGFDSLAVEVITAPSLRLDTPADRQRLANTVQALQPRLLVLDPLIRLHQLDENDAGQIAGLLSFLRQLQRQFQLAVLLVHHARKDAHDARPGQALRGSSELHGWGDSNLYMRRKAHSLSLSTEHRAAASQNHIPLELSENPPVALSVTSTAPSDPPPQSEPSASERVRRALSQLDQPASVQQVRQFCGMRTATVCNALNQLCQQGLASRSAEGYRLKPPLEPSFPVSHPIDPQGNGNGKRSD